jgi:hypothetical protein
LDELTTDRLQTLILRISLVASVAILWHSNGVLREVEYAEIGALVWLQVVEFLLAFVMLIVAARRQVARWSIWFIPVALLLVVVNRAIRQSILLSTRGGVELADVYLFTEYAALLFRAGQNPYVYDLFDSFRSFGALHSMMTPLIQHDVSGALVYPSLSFLVLIPFQLLGLPSNYTYVVFYLLSLVVVFRSAPPAIRPLVLLPFFIDPNPSHLAFIGLNDSVWSFMLVMTVATWRHNRQRAVWYGLACAVKQHPLLIAPFLVIRIWHETSGSLAEKARSILLFAGVSGGIFTLVNLPFIVADFEAWLNSILVFTETQIIISSGLSRLTQLGVVMMPRSIYSLFMLAAYALGLFLYWRHFSRWREALWLVPGIVLYFNYRALDHYWVYLTLPLILSVIRTEQPSHDTVAIRDPNWRWSAAALASFGFLIVGVTMWYGLRPNPLTIELIEPATVEDDRIYQLEAHVANNSDQPLTPRLSIRSRSDETFQAQFWHIDRGPEILEPGASADYAISGTWPLWGINPQYGAQLIVTDANSYDLRARTVVEPTFYAAYPGIIPNGDYAFWRGDEEAPYIWQAFTVPTAPGTVERIELDELDDGFPALRLTLPDRDEWSRVLLETEIVFPDIPIQIWVKPPAESNIAPDFAIVYGVELFADDQRVWVLFGDEASLGEIEPGLSYTMIPAPRDEWSQQTLDVRQIYADLGIEIADLTVQQITRLDHLNVPKTRLEFGLLLAGESGAAVTANFGAVSQPRLQPDRAALAQSAVQHPERMLLWHGDFNRQQLSFGSAIDYYAHAFDYAPDEAWAVFGRGQSYLERGETLDEGSALVNQAREMMLAQPERYSNDDVGQTYWMSGQIFLQRRQCLQAQIAFTQAQFYAPAYQLPVDALDGCGN